VFPGCNAIPISIFPILNTIQQTTMPDILFILAAVGFFALMIAFIWACDKV